MLRASGGGNSSNSGGGSSGGGSSSNTSSSSTPLPSPPVTVPVSGDEKNIQVNAAAVNDPNNHAKGLEIVLTNGTSVELGAGVLGEKALQAKVSDITISSRPLTDSSLNSSLGNSLNGSKQLCETSYDPIRKQVSWKTNPLSPSSVYMIGYDEKKLVKPDTNAYAAYTVQKGNTLSAIAKKHGCTVADIIAANSDLIKNPNRIHAGWQLKIPQK